LTIKIVIADPTRPAYAQAAREVLREPDWEVLISEGFADADLVPLADECDILITRRRPIPAAFMERATKVRSVQHIGSQVRPEVAAWAKERGIPLEITPSLGNIAVAEQAMALLLGVSRKVIQGHLGTVSGAYRERNLTPVVTSEVQIAFQWLSLQGISLLYGKTIGIVGFGDIGQSMARMANGFGMRVLYNRRHRLDTAEEQRLSVAYSDLDEMIRTVDYLSLHVPHTPETDKLINAKRLRAMKKGSFLINVCRGGVVDEVALVEVLREGHLGGAGLDVFVEEPVPYDNPLLQLDNVCLSPHLGSAPARGLGESLSILKPNLLRLLSQ
jgi:D-3-phosphoglycerate dehydrogenase